MSSQTQSDEYTVAMYHFDYPDPNAGIDSSPNHHDGTLHGGATITNDGLFNGALQVNGVGSYFQTGNLGPLSQGTIEAFIDFSTGCDNWYFPIISAGGEYGSGQNVLLIRSYPWLNFGIMMPDGQWQWVTSQINTCKYLAGPSGVVWPYEAWRFHHVAATWGPRGVEMWVDGVLHGVGVPLAMATLNPRPQYGCNPQDQAWGGAYPYCPSPHMGLVPGAYSGGMQGYNTFLIGCAADGGCFKGRIDELRISNIQRTFDVSVDPPSTPTPTSTPSYITGEYAVDSDTLALYHLNQGAPSGLVYLVKEEVSQQWKSAGNLKSIVPEGRFGSGLSINGQTEPFQTTGLGNPGNGSVESWVKLSDASQNFIVIGGKQYYNSGPDMYLGAAGDPSNRTIRFGIESNGWHWADSGINPTALVGYWHHLAGTWGSRGLEIWIDGQLCQTNISYTASPLNPIYAYLAGCGTNGQCTIGTLDEIRFSKAQRNFSSSGLLSAVTRSAPSTAIRRPLGAFQLFLPFVRGSPYVSCGAH